MTTRSTTSCWTSSSPIRTVRRFACRPSGRAGRRGLFATPRRSLARTGIAPSAQTPTTPTCTAWRARSRSLPTRATTRCSVRARCASRRTVEDWSTPTARRSSGWAIRGGWACARGWAGLPSSSNSPPTVWPRGSRSFRSWPACTRTCRSSTRGGPTRPASRGNLTTPESTPPTSTWPTSGWRIWCDRACCHASSAAGDTSCRGRASTG